MSGSPRKNRLRTRPKVTDEPEVPHTSSFTIVGLIVQFAPMHLGEYQKMGRELRAAGIGVEVYPEAKKVIKVYDVSGSKLTNGKTFVNMDLPGKGAGLSDGIRCDIDGNVWSSAGWVGSGYDGVHVFAPDSQRIGMILLPEICSNLCFGGAKRSQNTAA